MTRTADTAILCGLGAAALVTKASALGTPAYWDELGWLGQAMRLADGSLIQALPGFRPAEAFVGHPPLLHLLFGVAAKVFGPSVVTAHAIVLAFAIAGLCFTFLIGKQVFDRGVGVLAAVLLWLSPMYFAQSAMFLADLPVTALAAASVYFVLAGRSRAFLASATAMVLIKETAAAIVIAIAMYDFFITSKRRWPPTRATAMLTPLFALGVFVGWQKAVTDHWWLIYGEGPITASQLTPTRGSIVRVGRHVVEWIFGRQLRFVWSAVIAWQLLTRARAREWWLFAFIAAAAAAPFAFASLFFLPRYVMPVVPFFFIASAWAILSLARSLTWRVAAGAIAVGLAICGLTWPPFEGNGEFNMHYRDVVATHRDMAEILERDFGNARVLTVWPHSSELVHPRFGYVRAPMAMATTLSDADVVLTTLVPETLGMRELRDNAVAAGWRVVRTVERGLVVSELFQRPPP